MKREYWERIGLERELVNLIMAENGRDIEALRTRAESETAEREAAAVKLAESAAEKLAEAEAERGRLIAELAEARSAPPSGNESAHVAALEAALAEQKEDYEKTLSELKAKHESALSDAEAGREAALASQKAEYEAVLAEHERRSRITELFGRASFTSAFVLDAAVERFLDEGGSPENAGEWLTAFRNAEPNAFARAELPSDLPRFTSEAPASDGGDADTGGLLSAVLKKLR